MPQNLGTFKRNIGLISLMLAACMLVTGCKDGIARFSAQEEAKKQLEAIKGPEVKGMEATMKGQAETAVKAGSLAQAETMYQQLRDKYPDNIDYSYGYADVLRREDKCDTALPVYESILKTKEDDAGALEGKGLCVMGKGDVQRASKLFSAVMKVDEHRWRTLNALGILFAMKGMPDEAMAYYKEALKHDANPASVNNNIGLTHTLNKKYNDAIVVFQTAILQLPEDSPDIKRLALNLALTYGLAGRMDEAERTAAPYLSKAALYNNLGFYAYLAKNDVLAKSYLNMSLSTSPSYYERAWDNLQGMEGGGPDTSDIELPTLSKQPAQSKEKPKAKAPEQPKQPKQEAPAKKAESAKQPEPAKPDITPKQ